jgi:hypothetical protein
MWYQIKGDGTLQWHNCENLQPYISVDYLLLHFLLVEFTVEYYAMPVQQQTRIQFNTAKYKNVSVFMVASKCSVTEVNIATLRQAEWSPVLIIKTGTLLIKSAVIGLTCLTISKCQHDRIAYGVAAACFSC